MDSAKDFGFFDGVLLDEGEPIPTGHTYIPGQNGAKALSLPQSTLEEEHANYLRSGGITDPDFNRSYVKAIGALKAVGVSATSSPRDVKVGTDFRGNGVYSNIQLANSQDLKPGKTTAKIAGGSIGAMGGFSDSNEANRFFSIGNKAADPNYLKKLDTLKTGKDVKGFTQTIGGGFTGFKLYENWNNLSPTQKSLAVAHAGMQSYRFNDGKDLLEKRVTPDVKNVPGVHVAEGMALAGEGVNVAPATRKWKQMAPLQETVFKPKTGSDTVRTANSMGLLGFGMDGQAVPIDSNKMSAGQMTPVPNYGVGAVSIPVGTGIPQGYRKIRDLNGTQIAIPNDNISTAALNAPEVASQAALDVYSRWSKEGAVKQVNGVVGGSALVGGLNKMTSTNPYTLGAQTAYFTFQHVGADRSRSQMENISHMTGITLQRLLKGGASKAIDSSADLPLTKGNLEEKTFNAFSKNARGELARQGISSKEIGYQLANQGFAEGRYNESELVAIYRNLDMVFDPNGFTLAEKLSTGYGKGLEILEGHSVSDTIISSAPGGMNGGVKPAASKQDSKPTVASQILGGASFLGMS